MCPLIWSKKSGTFSTSRSEGLDISEGRLMRKCLQIIAISGLALQQTGCGTVVPKIPEAWDLVADTDATQHMEMQIKRAIFCELRDAVRIARNRVQYKTYYHGKLVSTAADQPIPDSWGVQQTLTFTVDEQSKVTPSATYTWPLNTAASQTFALTAGGQLSSDATRTDKFSTFYTIAEIANVLSESQVCEKPQEQFIGQPSHSSPFTVLSDLGIRDWLPAATETSAYLRSSRSAASGEGPPLGTAGSFASDSFSYDVKFVIVTDGNLTPTWKLLRVTTASSPALFDTSRTRTHELLLTIGPGATTTVKNSKGQVVSKTVGPSNSAASSHLAQEIGSAVATALRPAIAPTGVTVP
ncbi:hypothetical protein [Bradyrhizobium uaiense]|uniref:Uncharacterized protein n=1 Tax=Bradyrhizobium uaiense TaxID=2594946 RepID=A0A6P1BET1_9BRAD|nr:hypothetical protein [Bradyrhizobium uaiense]NEU96925.1 hypothetical protein [Bradyrhizobium uaiense]